MDLTVVIISWNVKKLLANCLVSLRAAQKGLNLEVIVVDNNSSDGTVQMLKTDFNDVALIENRFNAGYAKAANQAIARATGKYVLILNPDTEVTKKSLQHLVSYANENTNVALMSPKITNADGTFQFGSIRRNPTVLSQVLIKFMHARRLWKYVLPLRRYFMYGFDSEREQEIEQVMGAAMFFRRADLDEVGYFDERFFIWFEDVDLCYRFQKMNKEIRYIPNAEIVHHGGESFKQRYIVKKQWFYNKSLIQYFMKHGNLLSVLLLLAVFPINMCVAFIYQLFQSHGK